MRYTIFSCGVFMESFHPGGLGFLNIGYGSNVSGAGDYLLDINNGTAEYARYNSAGRTVRLCLTSVSDLVRFIVAALDLGPRSWPREFTMRGDRLSVFEVVETCSRAKNGKTLAIRAWDSFQMTRPLPRVARRIMLTTGNQLYSIIARGSTTSLKI